MADGNAGRSDRFSRILLVVDKYGWSYDTIAKGIVEHNDRPHLTFDILSAKEDATRIEQVHDQYDLVFVLGWTDVFSKKKGQDFPEQLPFLDQRRLISGIHSHRSWDDYQSEPASNPAPPATLVEKLSGLKGVNIISRRLHTIFQDAGLANATLTENGVDTRLFKPAKPINTDRLHPLVIGFSGSTGIPKHDHLKGLSQYILPLGELPGVEVRVLGGRGPEQVAREHMPPLYNEIDLYICASTSEGFSQSVLEASACGRGILTTRVGGCEDLVEEGSNGFFIERDLDMIMQRVAVLEQNRGIVSQLGRASRKRIEQDYSWAVRVRDWLDFIETHLPATRHAATAFGAHA